MMEFKTQVCTTREQSILLLELGLKPETANMHIELIGCSFGNIWNRGTGFSERLYKELPESYIPAWSLHRLMVIGEQNNISFNNLENAYESSIALINNDVRFGVLNKKYLNK